MFCNRIHIIFTLLAGCASIVTACVGNPEFNTTNSNLPAKFPCQWVGGMIPYAFDFYSINSNRLIKSIRQGLELIQNQSCLVFKEHNPISVAECPKSYYYLYYTHSNSLENCCAAPIEPGLGRRVVLITPGCKEPHEIAHVTLHMLGISHGYGASFSMSAVNAVLHLPNCRKRLRGPKFSRNPKKPKANKVIFS